MTEGVKDVLKCIEQYPDLPVVVAVSNDVVYDDSYAWWEGEINGACVEKICTSKDGGVVFYDSTDIQDTLVSILSNAEFAALPKDDEGRKRAFEALPWREVVVIFVGY